MAMHNPLGSGRRSRQRSLDGSVPGLSHMHHGRPTTPPLGSPRPRAGGHQQDLYGWGLPREYRPHWNAPAVHWDEYATDTDGESHQVQHPRPERLLGPFPPREPAEPAFDYEQAKELDTFFLQAMETQYRPHREGEIIPSTGDLWMEHAHGGQMGLEEIQEAGGPQDPSLSPQDATATGLPRVEDIGDALAQLRHVLREDHPDIVRLETALQMQSYPSHELEMPVESGVDPGSETVADRYRHDLAGPPDALLGIGDAAVEQPFELPATEFGGDDEMGLPVDMDLGLEALLAESMPQVQPSGLEQLIEQGGSFEDLPMGMMEQESLPDAAIVDSTGGMTAYEMLGMDEINMAVDRVMEQPAPQEIEPGYEPTPVEQDPFAMAQDIFNQQMQFMANPLMMPGM